MILGNVCTRRCGFCAIESGKTEPVSQDEPQRVAFAAYQMKLSYVVITSVARDDLSDEGAGQFAKTVLAVREKIPESQIEVLTPDFHAKKALIEQVLDTKPQVYNHNLETVERLQRKVRVQGRYDRSLQVLELVKEIDPEIKTKSGLMLGLGESDEEILEAARSLRKVGCDILTVGQYLPPSQKHLEVVEYKSPQYFLSLSDILLELGFQEVYAGPYIRSSYHAGEIFNHMKQKEQGAMSL